MSIPDLIRLERLSELPQDELQRLGINPALAAKLDSVLLTMTTSFMTMILDTISMVGATADATLDGIRKSQAPFSALVVMLAEKGVLGPADVDRLEERAEAIVAEMSAGTAVDQALTGPSEIQKQIAQLQAWLRAFNELNSPPS